MLVPEILPVMKLIAAALVLNLSAGHYSIEPFRGGSIARLHYNGEAFAPFPATESPQNEESVLPVISFHHRHHRRKRFHSLAPSSSHQDIKPISGSPLSSSYAPFNPPEPSPAVKGRQNSPSPHDQGDCSFMECSEPLTITPPEFPCLCVSPIQVAIRLGIALYTFFPLVSELSKEVAAGTQLKQSQVRVVGANSGGQQPEKTVILIDLVPFGTKFDPVMAFQTYYRFLHKRVSINTSLFGHYDVLGIQYSGLPPAPSMASSEIKGDDEIPPSGKGGGGWGLKPVGIDVGGGPHHHSRLSERVVVSIVVSASIAVGLFSFSACVLLKLCSRPSTPKRLLPPIPLGQSGGTVSTVESGFSIASISLASSISTIHTGSAKLFSSGDIKRATDNFDPTKLLGEGGFGLVYGGVLEDGTEVAVKILKRVDEQGEREFLSEVEMLTRLHHRNLVKLIGICAEEQSHSLVYELISNGSVESHLHGADKEASPLDWDTRMKIALGAARALAYLHEDSRPSVIHRDFKSSNILLDHDFTPKVSDFGLAKSTVGGHSKLGSTHVMGTFGYVAPEYAMTGNFLVKSDVYSYGVVLLELLTGRRPVDMLRPSGQESLVGWARTVLSTPDGLGAVLDPLLVGPALQSEGVAKVATLASLCIHPEPSCRPFMGEVVQALRLVSAEHGLAEAPSERTAGSDLWLRPSFSDFLRAGGGSGSGGVGPAPVLTHSKSTVGPTGAAGSPARWLPRSVSDRGIVFSNPVGSCSKLGGARD